MGVFGAFRGIFLLGIIMRFSHGELNISVSTETDKIPNITVSTESNNKKMVLGLIVPVLLDWTLAESTAAAVVPALERVSELQLLPGYDIDWVWINGACNLQLAVQEAANLHESEAHLTGFIGPLCGQVAEILALLGAAWNLPVVSYYAVSSALSDKSTYPTFARVMGLDAARVPIVNAVMDEFGWDHAAVIGTTLPQYASLAQQTKTYLERANKVVFYHVTDPPSVQSSNWIDMDALEAAREVVAMAKEESRFICLLMMPKDVRMFLLLAYDLGMMNGEYIFYGPGIFVEDGPLANPDYRPEVEMMELFEGFLTTRILPVSGPAWEQLQEDVVQGFQAPQFDGLQGVTDPAAVIVVAAYIYDAVLLWAHGVNRTIAEGGDPSDGIAVASSMFNFTFEDGMTGVVSIDEKGDRKVDRLVSIIQPGPQTTILFKWNAALDQLEQVYNAETPGDWGGLTWAGGVTTLPSGAPPCGWQAELCITTPQLLTSTEISSIVAGLAIGALGLAMAATAYKWFHTKIRHDEVQKCFLTIHDIITTPVDRSFPSPNPSMNPDANRTLRKFHNGQEVAVRGFDCTSGLTTRVQFLDEILQIKKLHHSHLNPFIGVSFPSPQRVYLVMAHATRGSLYDVIQNKNFKFSPELRMSLLTDIVEGMGYLHSTLCEPHGHLTSYNCVIDQRWTLKITDYGFSYVRGHRSHRLETDERELWVAPEVLRGELEQSQQCDVYAFAIIASEIFSEGPPYAHERQEIAIPEIVTAVMITNEKPMRPCLALEVSDRRNTAPNVSSMTFDAHGRDRSRPPSQSICETPSVFSMSKPSKHQHNQRMIELISSCWTEDAQDRPAFSSILRTIMMINGGSLPRLVDNMIHSLEKHTQMLEEVVSQRSAHLKEEKLKLELLLNELLPPYIAQQLQIGDQVKPEDFEEVTLSFTDIVGFTSISSRLTPIQVIGMLNKLYSCFDHILNQYDVYKVATIGDAYLVASGVPVRNGDRHAREIAAMSLELLHVIGQVELPQLFDKKLQLRIGLHSGPCVAGVTGVKTPRYMLFGETVDVAAKIEAGSEPMRVLASGKTAQILSQFDEFNISLHGDISIGAVRVINTYWISWKDPCLMWDLMDVRDLEMSSPSSLASWAADSVSPLQGLPTSALN